MGEVIIVDTSVIRETGRLPFEQGLLFKGYVDGVEQWVSKLGDAKKYETPQHAIDEAKRIKQNTPQIKPPRVLEINQTRGGITINNYNY